MKLARSTPLFRFEPSESQSEQRKASNIHDIASSLSRTLLSSGVVITGTIGQDGAVTDGITFTAGQTVDVAHNMGRAAKGFLVLDATGSSPQLYRTKGQPAESEDKYVRLTHAGASTTVVKLLIL